MLMKQIRYALSLLVLCMSFTSAFATYVYKKGEQISSLTAGQEIIIQTAVTTADVDRYYSGRAMTTAIVDSTIYIVENGPVGTDGNPTFLFKNKKTGLYMSYPENYTSLIIGEEVPGIYYSANTDRAIAWQVGLPVTDNEQSPFSFIRKEGADYVNNYAPKNEKTLVVRADAKFTSRSVKNLYLSSYWGTSIHLLSFYSDTNIANIFLAGDIDGTNMLDRAIAIFGSGADFSTLYTVGSAVGNISSQEVVDALENAYNDALDVQANTSATETQKADAANALLAARDAVEAARVQLAEGYYAIRNAARGTDPYMYERNGQLLVKVNAAADTAANAYFIFHFTKNENGTYNIQNYGSKKYVKGTNVQYTTAVLTAADEADFTITPRTGAPTFELLSSFTLSNQELHADAQNKVVVWNTDDAMGGSSWYLDPISEDALVRIDEATKALALKDSLTALYPQAVKLLEKSRVYTSSATKDPKSYDPRGIVTDVANVWTNAGYNELGGNDGIGIVALIDTIAFGAGQTNNYFHSTYNAGHNVRANHYVAFNIEGTGVENFVIKMSRRPAQGNNSPVFMEVYATNDTTSAGTWTHITSLGNLFTAAGDSAVISGGVELGQSYKYVRFDVTRTINNASINGVPFFTLGELAIYGATYDASQSQYANIANAEAFKAAVKAAAPVYLGTQEMTEAVYTALKTEYDIFFAQFADISKVQAAYNTANGLHNAAQEGTTSGYFTVGSRATFKAAIDAALASVTATSTPDQMNAAIEAINTAKATFNAALIMPAVNSWMRIKSTTTQSAGDVFARARHSFAYANITDTGISSRWTGADTTGYTQADFLAATEIGYNAEKVDNRMEFIWRFVQDGDSLKLQNYATGYYLNSNMGYDSVGTKMVLEFAAPGSFQIRFANGNYINAQPNTTAATKGEGALVTYSVSLDANNLFTFVPYTVEADIQTNKKFATDGDYRIVTYPFTVTGKSAGTTYSILGTTEDKTKLVLSEVEGTPIAAGTPFVYKTSATEADSIVEFYIDGATDIVANPGKSAGVQGTFGSYLLRQPQYGVYIKEKIESNLTGVRVYTFSGYLTPDAPTTTETGSAQLTIDGAITNLKDAVIISNKALVDVYTISGVLVKKGVNAANATTGLPAGLYVVGGVKVLVK